MTKQIIGIAVVLSACGLAAPERGTLVSDGVAQARFEARGNATDIVPVEVFYPAKPNGLPLYETPRPAVVLVQGGAVAVADYEWQAIALAKAGYVVALPSHPLNLAFFSIDNGQAARQLLVNPPRSVLTGLVDASRIGVSGHSLGGVVAMKLALEGGFGAVVLQASLPDAADDAKLPKLGLPSLSLAGKNDCSAALADVKAGWAKLPSRTSLVVLDGVTHYQFTGDETPDVKKGCASGVTLTDAHGRISRALVTFFDAAFFDGSVGEAGLRQLDGAEVQVR